MGVHRLVESPAPSGAASVGVRRSTSTSQGATRYELALPADATGPGRARALLTDAARAWELDDEVYQDAAMVVTERAPRCRTGIPISAC